MPAAGSSSRWIRGTQSPGIAFTQPIFDGNGGVAAILRGGIALTTQDLPQDIVDSRDDNRDTLIVVADANGRVIAHRSARG